MIGLGSDKNCLILTQNVRYGIFIANVTKNLTYALWENNSGSNSLCIRMLLAIVIIILIIIIYQIGWWWWWCICRRIGIHVSLLLSWSSARQGGRRQNVFVIISKQFLCSENIWYRKMPYLLQFLRKSNILIYICVERKHFLDQIRTGQYHKKFLPAG